MDPVLAEMMFELHERMLHLRRLMPSNVVKRHPGVLTAYYAMDGMYHTVEEELRVGRYLPTTYDRPEPSASIEDDPRP